MSCPREELGRQNLLHHKLHSNTPEIPDMQQPWVFFMKIPQKSIEITFLQCTIPKQTPSFPHHSSQLWEVWNRHFLFVCFLFVLVLFYSYMSLKCLGTLFSIYLWLMPEMTYQSILEKVHDHGPETWKCEGQDSYVAPEAERNFVTPLLPFIIPFIRYNTFSICS